MPIRRLLKGLAIGLAIVVAVAILIASINNWNWLRGPIGRQVADATGRALTIRGDLDIRLGWPSIRIGLANVTFANPTWSDHANMIVARNVSLDLSIPPLFRRAIVFDRVRLDRATVSLEKSTDGRKNWLLDRKQMNDKSRVVINHLAVRDGRLTYQDPGADTRLDARVSTRERSRGGDDSPLMFQVSGRYKGQPLSAQGGGDGVLALRDSTTPYRLNVTGRIGSTHVVADGRVSNLLKISAVDLQIKIRGDSLARLYPILGIVLPDTPPYTTEGRLRHAADWWRYEKFSGTVGRSDIAGSLQVHSRGRRPFLSATLSSRHLDLADLGPLVGASSAPGKEDSSSEAGRILPATPFRTARWDRMDADVKLKAQSIKRAASLPLNDLSTRLQLRDAVVTLDPLRFGVADGTLSGTIRLDGRQRPIRAQADLKARKISLVRLFPAAGLEKTSLGHVNGYLKLHGRGDTVGAMLGSADGGLAMVVNGGEISKLMMETVSLHLLEMLQLTLTGDKSIKIQCGIADFGVKQGVMQANTLVLDTDIVRIDGKGQVDLGQERLDLTIVPKTKKLSLLALRSPIHVEGSFAQPAVAIDKGALALRGLGAVALGAVNPALALMPLIDTGSGSDSDCSRLISRAKPAPSRSPDS
ncbi:MAG: AsmA family protein [Thiobacillus sp.]|nr:AsmA family protein [Thiobacillus sp.]